MAMATEDAMALVKSEISPLIRKRAYLKGRVTQTLKYLKQFHTEERLTTSICRPKLEQIENNLNEIKKYDEQIMELLLIKDVRKIEPGYFDHEFESQVEYEFLIAEELEGFSSYRDNTEGNNTSAINNSFVEVLNGLKFEDNKLPLLKCDIFSGEKEDKFAFNSFLNQFKNLVGSKTNLSKAVKLGYLQSFLKGDALKVISGLSLIDDNYDKAVELLCKQ